MTKRELPYPIISADIVNDTHIQVQASVETITIYLDVHVHMNFRLGRLQFLSLPSTQSHTMNLRRFEYHFCANSKRQFAYFDKIIKFEVSLVRPNHQNKNISFDKKHVMKRKLLRKRLTFGDLFMNCIHYLA